MYECAKITRFLSSPTHSVRMCWRAHLEPWLVSTPSLPLPPSVADGRGSGGKPPHGWNWPPASMETRMLCHQGVVYSGTSE